MMLQDLPDQVLQRIAMTVGLDGGPGPVLKFMLTCSDIYHPCLPVLVRLKPLTVVSGKLNREKGTVNTRDLQKMRSQYLGQIRYLNLCNFTHNFDRSRLEDFASLVSLTVESPTFDFFVELPRITRTLRSLTFIYSKKHFSPIREQIRPLPVDELKEKADSFPPLRSVRVSCSKPTINGPFNGLISKNAPLPSSVEEFHSYFQSSSYTQLQKIVRFMQKEYINLGHILNVLIKGCSGSLSLVEVENLDFSYIMAHSPGLPVRNGMVILADNASIVHLYSWINRVKTPNLTLLIEDNVGSVVHHITSKDRSILHSLKAPAALERLRATIYSTVLH